MKRHVLWSTALLCLGLAISVSAQPPRDGGGRKGQKGQGGPRPPGQGGGMDSTSPIDRIMSLDANGDGVLTPAEVTDQRLQNLLQRADANSDSQVTKAELQALFAAESANMGMGQGGAFGGPGMGPPPEGGGMGRPRPGEVLPAFMMDQLQLTDEQRQQIAELQKQVDARLAEILTDEQEQMLLQGPQGGPGGGGPPGQAGDMGTKNNRRSKSGRTGGGQK